MVFLLACERQSLGGHQKAHCQYNQQDSPAVFVASRHFP
jgi:hypothetical protein